jgi:hypothetical protein
MKRAVFFTLVAAILLVPWAIAYGYDKVNAADISASIVPAEQADVPTVHIFGNYTGSISNGDLFIIDTTGATADITFNLVMANLDELVGCYRAMNMNIAVYVQSGDATWQKMTAASLAEMNINMETGSLNFSLPGNARYKVTVEKGSYRSFSFTKAKNVAIPQFSLTAS